MRVYFEKPRTTVGWKGLINDPDMDDSCHIEKGIRTARSLLLDLAAMGIPTATEALDPIMPQYMGDLISWTAIGARTTESQTHREMASGLSTPVGFKNGTDGSLQVAINALKSARQPHHFLGINQDGRPAVIHTKGNPYGHVVLRGGGGRPNYDSVCVALSEKALKEGRPAGAHRGRLQPRQFQQGPVAAAARREGLRGAGGERQPLHHRPHAGEQPQRGQPGHSGGPLEASLRRIRDGRLHRLGDDGSRAKGGCGTAAPRGEGAQKRLITRPSH